MWIVDGGESCIGYVKEPDELCRVEQWPSGEQVVATFSAYVKDLQRVEPRDDSEAGDALPSTSYSWIRANHAELGAAKQAILMLLAARSIGADGFIELCRHVVTKERSEVAK